ncbi:beta-alanine-activating enzyme [Hyalella azteca]|uniref:Beta-alanine-activating enzyme n=1 Tax=Hyalella azteca TaxID=294128 RepID=A0A8B7NMA7_HYAAZ|nr:beta-alanine-activating enzyme [Hyalella azteca]
MSNKMNGIDMQPGSLLKHFQEFPESSLPAITYIHGSGAVSTISYGELCDAVVHVSKELSHKQKPSSAGQQQRPLLVVVCGRMHSSTIAVLLAALNSDSYFYIDPDQLESSNTRDMLTCLKPDLVLIEESINFDFSWLGEESSYLTKIVKVVDKKFTLHSFQNPCSFFNDFKLWEIAYVITTSGSTGIPKMVFVPRSCVAPNISDLLNIFYIVRTDVIFSAAPLSFDPSIVNILMSLNAGSHLVVADKNIISSVAIIDILLTLRVSVFQITPSLLNLWQSQQNLAASIFHIDSHTRLLALGGETPPITLLKSLFRDSLSIDIFSLYGISEVSSWSSVKKISFATQSTDNIMIAPAKDADCVVDVFSKPGFDILDLGQILSETTLCLVKNDEILNRNGEGEIYLGRQSSCGVYEVVREPQSLSGTLPEIPGKSMGDVRLKKVIPLINDDGVKLFPSGDLGRKINNVFYYMGRCNRVVKCYGQKVNLNTIEEECLSVPGVEMCRAISEGDMIFCFCVAGNQESLKISTLRRSVRKITSVPCQVYMLSSLPLTAHGKVDDKRMLKDLTLLKCKGSITEKFLVQVVDDLWFDYCSCKPTQNMNFISLGMDSLRAVEFLEILQHRVGSQLLGMLDSLLMDRYEVFLEGVKRSVVGHSDLRVENSTSIVQDQSSGRENAKKTKTDNDKFVYVMLSKVSSLIQGKNAVLSQAYLPDSDRLTWTLNLGKCIDATPILVQSQSHSEASLLIGSHSGRFCCVDALTGAVRWSNVLENRLEASPTVDRSASHVYAACYSGFLYCMSLVSGSLLWKFKANAEIKCSPLVDYESGCIYFGSHDKNFYCLNPNGSLIWKNLHSGGSIFSSPCVGDNTVFAACLKGVVAGYEKYTGKLIWKFSLNAPVFSSLVCFSRGVLCTSVDGNLTALSPKGEFLWCCDLSNQCYCTPRVVQLKQSEVICVGDNSGCVSFVNELGIVLGHFNVDCRVVATPFLYNCRGATVAVVAATNGKMNFLKLSFVRDESGVVSSNVDGRDIMLCGGSVQEAPHVSQKPSIISRECKMLKKNDFSHSPSDTISPISLKCIDECAADLFYGIQIKSVYELSYPGEIFSSPLVFQSCLYVCGRDDTVQCYELLPR